MNSETSWVSKTIFYQIYPRSFKDSNNDGIGDLRGIAEKLDYLAELGINGIWLSPIYKSPMVDFGYDISDHKSIDPIFGNLEDFKDLLNKAHAKGIKVIMDYIPNHTSDEHPWFIESRSSKTNKKRDYYIWADPKEGDKPPSNWVSVFGGSAWEYDEKTKQYYLHSFGKNQPDLNWRNPEVVKEMFDVLEYWLELGVDGFRVDAVYFLFKDTRFLDEPFNPAYIIGIHEPFDKLLHPYTLALPETLEMMKRMVNILNNDGDKFMVAEVYTHMEELIRIYNTVSHKHFAPFNFAFITLPFRASIHKQFINEYDQAVGNMYFPTFVLGNHDRPRIASRVGKDLSRLGAVLLLTLRGIPFIYYGDEIGMEDGYIPYDKAVDIWEKNMPGLNLGRDPERTPMQWDKEKYAGFSDKQPWLPISKNYKKINTETQKKDPKSIYSLYKKLIEIKQTSPALLYGQYSSWEVKNPHVYVYTRIHQNERILVALNYSGEVCQIINLPFNRGQMLCNTFLDVNEGEIINLEKISLKPYEGVLIRIL